MVKKEANLTAIMLVQQLNEEYWLSSDYTAPLLEARDGNCRPLLEMVIEKLEKEDIVVKEGYIIKHDKDEHSIWNPEKLQNTIESKAIHVHILLKFEKGASLSKIALAIGVKSEYLEKLKSGRYGYDNCLAYLVHAKDETKYQYQPHEVVTVRGEDYSSIYHRCMETWVKGRATKKAHETNLSIDWLVEKILAGELTKSNILLTNDYYAIYGQHKRKVNEALETAGERKSYQTIAELEAGKFKKTILYIYAESGSGKTKYCKKLIELLQTIALKYGQKWEYCLTASINAFDEYNGQDILFLDDIRGDSLSVSDWLKLLDPYTISPISARYHNKMGSAKVIIITTTIPSRPFFQQSKGNIDEDSGQFVRRIDYSVNIKDKFHFYAPTRVKNENKEIPKDYYFQFKEIGQFESNKATNKLVKLVIQNMKWNELKKVIIASDQTNNDNLS